MSLQYDGHNFDKIYLDAIEEGRAAFQDGVPFDDNPYRHGKLHDCWSDGWWKELGRYRLKLELDASVALIK